MALKATKQKRYTPKEYLALEEKAEFRSEFDDGQIVAMAGGTINHARITTNIDRAFACQLSKTCESFTRELDSSSNYRFESNVKFESIGVELSLETIYQRVEFTEN